MKGRIGRSFISTKNIWLLGIAFPDLLNLEIASDSSAKRQLRDPDLHLKIILLNPKSQAAQRRALIEDPDKICDEGDTICNIKRTILNNSKLLFRARMERKYGKDWKTIILSIKNNCENEDFFAKIISDINLNIKITDFDPISFIVATDNTLFTEQYNFGRPGSIDSTTTCIGGYLPVIQYKKSSDGYEFLKSHFDYIWNNKEMTNDLTNKYLKDILDLVEARPSAIPIIKST
jgi:hypothetical protein